MLEKTANTLAALLMLAAAATAADLPPVSAPPEPPAETLPEVISPAPPQPVNGDAVTFDTMDSIPFENAVEPPDDPPALDNGARTPAGDNTVPLAPAAPSAPPASPIAQ